MNEWISVDDRLPDEPQRHDQKWCDVLVKDERKVDVNFLNGKFHEVITDHQGDYSHLEEIERVTHWMIID